MKDDFVLEESEHVYSIEDNNLGLWMVKLLLSALLTPIWMLLELFEVHVGPLG